MTYERALEIVKLSDVFYLKSGKIHNMNYTMFNYRLAQCEDFEKYDAYELRGLTFIEYEGKWYKYPMLKKFFNLNQCPCTQYEIIKDKEIKSVSFKEDGSLISLMLLPDGKTVVPKTKMSFDNEQTKLTQQWLNENPGVIEFVKKEPLMSYLFELVSPMNKIVLKYQKTELKLLQARGIFSGDYYDNIGEIAKQMGIGCSVSYSYSLDELIEMKKTKKNIEGWVVKFLDGQFIKIKTDDYLEKHGLMEDLNRENIIIQKILDETIDDILSELEVGSEEYIFVNNVIKSVNSIFNHRVSGIKSLVETYYTHFKDNRKDFAINFSKINDFGIVMKCIGSKEEIENISQKLLKNKMKQECNSLEKARAFLYENTTN